MDLVQHVCGRAHEVFTVDGVLSAEEAAVFRGFIDHVADDERRFSMAGFKNGKVVRDEWAHLMWERLKGAGAFAEGVRYVDGMGDEWEVVGACRNVMYALVHPGQGFPIHTDTGCVWEEDGDVRSRFTVLIYLNDGYDGGRTVFYDDAFAVVGEVEPKEGRALVFDIDNFHSGEVVGEGGSKYWIGTELVARRKNKDT